MLIKLHDYHVELKITHPYSIQEWNKLDLVLKQCESLGKLKSVLLRSIRPSPNSIFNIRDNHGLKVFSRLRLSKSSQKA